jgi:hypothetical protein
MARGKVVRIKGRGKRKPKPRRMTPELLAELISIHFCCVHDQEGKCPLLISIKSLCWEINKSMNLAGEEDAGFRRVDPMCAARPLTVRFNSEEHDE